MPKPYSRVRSTERHVPTPKPEVTGGVFRKVFKNPNAKHRHYPENLQCSRCGDVIPDFTPFYSKKVGGKNQRTIYYCENCVIAMFIEVR